MPRITGVVSICTWARPRLAIRRLTVAAPSAADVRTCNRNGGAARRWAIRVSASAIWVASVSKSCIGSHVRSMSTDSRGRSCSNRLIAVPPFSANRGSESRCGRIATSRATRSVYRLSKLLSQIGRERDQVFGVKSSPGNKHALATAEIHIGERNALQPRVLVSLGERQEQSFGSTLRHARSIRPARSGRNPASPCMTASAS